jgi:hypothetical protein
VNIQSFERCILGGGNPEFDLVVALDYYDGPERGVALYSTGAALRFSTLGESRSRCFRAFEFVAIDGSWWDAAVNAVEPDGSHRIVVPAASSLALTQFEHSVAEAVPTGTYLAVGNPALDWIEVCPASSGDLCSLREMNGATAAFHRVHQLIKDRRAA